MVRWIPFALAILAIWASSAAAASPEKPAPPAEAGAAPSEHARRPVATRLWYRLRLDVNARYERRAGSVTHTRESAWFTKSKAAVIVYRQCSVRGGLTGRELETTMGVRSGRSLTCAAVRSRLGRRARGLRLVEDLRFTAAITGRLTAYRNQRPVDPETIAAPGREPIQCPGLNGAFTQTLTEPAPLIGRLTTASFVLDGVNANVGPGTRSVPGRYDTAAYECVDPATGGTVRQLMPSSVVGQRRSGSGSLITGDVPAGDPFGAPMVGPAGSVAARGPVVLKPIRTSRVVRKFGSRFVLSGTQRASLSWPTGFGEETRTVSYRLAFTPCPGGGRRVRRC